MAEVVVIGAGVGGLSSAIRLASAGHSVKVFEAGSEAGGKIGRQACGGVEFDTGPSVLTMRNVFEELFDAAGTSLDDELALVRHDRVFEYAWPDGTRLDVYFEPERTIASVRETLGAKPADQLAAFLTYARGIWEAAAPAFVYGDAPTFGTAVGLGLRSFGAIRRIDPMRSMIDGIRRHVKEPHLVDLLARYATYNGSDPWSAPATLNCIAHVELALGCYGVEGGMYELARAMERVATGLGVDFRYDVPVRAIDSADGRVRGIVTDQGAVESDAVVANADVAHVFGELGAPGDAGDAAPSMSGWTGVLKAPRRDRAPHTAFFPSDYREEFRAIFGRVGVPAEPTVYVCAQEKAHHRAGWEEHEPLFLMANAPAVHVDSEADGRALRSSVERRLREEGWWTDDSELVWQRTPRQLAARFPGSRGSIYGAASNSRFSAFQRPSNRVGHLSGLYLASGSAHPGGGVPLCVLSGAAAARAVEEDFVSRETS